ncbi:MAG: polysaccharide export protein [Firmicutes bacterium]|nr:polysaccharide export protein [Bacillota bacterium]
MKKRILALIFTLFTILAAGGVVQAQPAPLPAVQTAGGEYTLAPGDILNVEVWGFEEFKPQNANGIVVRPDGKLSFPLVGEIVAGGLTVPALTDAITRGVSEYIHNPKVTVNVLKFHTTRVYVLGEVVRPGLYEIERQHNLLDAIGIAGGHTKNAAKKKVFIIRRGQSNAPIKANYDSILKKGDLSQNVLLSDGDVVYLADNGRIDFARDIMPFISAAYYLNDIGND